MEKRTNRIRVDIDPSTEPWKVARDIFRINNSSYAEETLGTAPVRDIIPTSDEWEHQFDILVQEPWFRYILVLAGVKEALRSYVLDKLQDIPNVKTIQSKVR